jgi:hypothetical protein
MAGYPHRAPDRTNRRAAARMEVDAPARLAGGATSLDGRLENVSETGLAFVTSTVAPEVPVGAHVVLVAAGAGDGGADREYRGRVVRTETLFDVTGEARMYAVELDAAAGA